MNYVDQSNEDGFTSSKHLRLDLCVVIELWVLLVCFAVKCELWILIFEEVQSTFLFKKGRIVREGGRVQWLCT